MTLTKLKNILIGLSSLLLISCFGGSISVPDDHYYRLHELKGEKITTPILKGTLSIKKVITHGIYGERTLIYTDKDNNIKLNRYHYHHWEKPPSLLIQDNLVQYLKTIGIANTVNTYNSNINSDHLLESELITMHRELVYSEYTAVISIDFRLYTLSNNTIIINKRYHSKIKTDSNKLVDTVEAYGLGFHKIYDEFISDLRNKN